MFRNQVQDRCVERIFIPLCSAISGPLHYRANARRTGVIRTLTQLCAYGLGAMAVCAGTVSAAIIDVAVLDRAGNPVADVIVLAESKTEEPLTLGAGQQTTFEMDQQNLLFDPYVLVVPVGATVNFLNNDTTAHHVYSFSKTNRFALPLHKSRAPDPVVFQSTGIVTLGCNIHDNMVAYIVVAESHQHARTDSSGNAKLTVDGDLDDIQVRIWSPRIRDKQNLLVQDASAAAPLRFALKKKLKPAYNPQPIDSAEWEEY